ncbi:MAG: deoxyribonuclease V [Chloroflexi bacterium]|nr:MAG: deoxyribonuclease V [Phototrophicales bacterium]RMF81383.1 MAG: deoxyribonuclease V [Chloroflexota bacterium]
MKIHHRHDWNLTPQQAITLQKELAAEIITDRPFNINTINLVAGVDVSVKHHVSNAAVVVVTFPELEPIETVTTTLPTPFPYVPGLLSFREGPVLIEAFAQLQHEPDVFIFDGMGIMHPRRIGIASHLGLWLQKPAIGCGKKRLVGEFDMPGNEKGSRSRLTDKGAYLGDVVRTRTNVKPVFISVGHLADIDSAVDLVLRCTPKYRLPRPIRLAHNAAGEF